MKAKKGQAGRIIDYQYTFGTEQGKRVLLDLMRAHHILSPSYINNDPHETSFREGERNVILRILGIVNIDNAKLKELMKEEEHVN